MAVGIAVVGAVASPAVASAEDGTATIRENAVVGTQSEKYIPLLDGHLPTTGIGIPVTVPVANIPSDPLGFRLRAQGADYKGFCLFGHNPNGSCRGASSAGAQCILGVAGGAGGGGLGGAALGPWGAAGGAAAGGALAASGACFKELVIQ